MGEPVDHERVRVFWSHIGRGTPTECWLWIGSVGRQGYGRFTYPTGYRSTAHRIAFYLSHGHWPMVGRHSCDNRRCCNPAHILDGTHGDNAHDRELRHPGTQPFGDANGKVKLTEANVAFIRDNPGGITQVELAQRFSVSKHTINRIVRGKTRLRTHEAMTECPPQ